MSHHSVSQPQVFPPTRRTFAVLLAPLYRRLTAPVLEWQRRREIVRGLAPLSDGELRDIGLTRADVEAACADSLDQPASEALARAAQHRVGNW